MGLSINNNVQGILAARQAEQTANGLFDGLRQLATQQRINQAGDDASGLAIAERFRTQVLQFTQEAENLQSGLNLAQTADGGLSAQQEAVGRIQELAVQAANGTLNDDQRAALNAEAQELLAQIDETAEGTEFNGVRPLDGSIESGLDLGAGDGATVNVNESTVESLGLDGLDLSTAAGAQSAIDQLNTAQARLDQNRAGVGAQVNRFEQSISVRETATQSAQESESAIRDLDVARATIEQTRNQLLLEGATSAIQQSGISAQSALNLLLG